MFGKGKRSVGVYIGRKHLLIAQVTHGSSVIAVEKIGKAELAPEAFDEDGMANSGVLSKVIKDLIATNGINGREVFLTLSSVNNIVMRTLTVPSMSRKETLEALSSEVENYAVLSNETPILDYQVIGQSYEGPAQRSEVLVVAAPKSLIRSYIASIESANLKIASIETSPLSIFRTLCFAYGTDDTSASDKGPEVIVSVEENGGTIAIADRQLIKFIHTIDIGRENLDSHVEELISEIESSVDYYQNTLPEVVHVQRIYLLFDGEDHKAVEDKLSSHFDIPVVIPFVPVEANHELEEIIQANRLSVCSAVGSALHGKLVSHVNLIPSRSTSLSSIKAELPKTFLVAASIVLLSFGADIALKSLVKSIENDTRSIRQQREGVLDGTLKPSSELEIKVANLKSQVEMIKDTINSIGRVRWFEVLPEISIIIPRSVWLKQLSWEENGNVVFSGSALDYESVFKFIDTLSMSSYFVSPKLIFIKEAKEDESKVLNFEINCKAKIERAQKKEDTIARS